MNDSDLRAVLRGIRDANYHRPGLRCQQLFIVDQPILRKLVEDVTRLRAEHSPSLPTTPGHVTGWTCPRGRVEQFSLLNASGRCDDYGTDHNLSCLGKQFHHSIRYPALGAVAGALPHLVNFRIHVLGPGAEIAPHEEHSVIRSRAGTVGVRSRFHLPLVTDPAATLVLDGDVHHLPAGTVHFVNHGCVHAAHNGGDAERIHLVWDMLLTVHAARAMFGEGPAPPGWTRAVAPDAAPVARQSVRRWQRIAPLVSEFEARHIDFLDVQ
ncbi:aspartyl/asparaginyl beta-hydroxylase domain-containing protein [Streptomyces sp. NPDC002550]